jgi:hypothetical protein
MNKISKDEIEKKKKMITKKNSKQINNPNPNKHKVK